MVFNKGVRREMSSSDWLGEEIREEGRGGGVSLLKKAEAEHGLLMLLMGTREGGKRSLRKRMI